VNHTLWHANLAKYSDAIVQEQIARGVLAIDSAVPGYKVRTFALPLGVWPKNRALASSGSWHDRRVAAMCGIRSRQFSKYRGRARRVRSTGSQAVQPAADSDVGQGAEKELDRLDASASDSWQVERRSKVTGDGGNYRQMVVRCAVFRSVSHVTALVQRKSV